MAVTGGSDSHSPPPSRSRSRSQSHEYEDDEQSDGIRCYEYSSDDEPKSKRTKQSKVDRLSELPESVIKHILSLMPVADAVKTSLLSKQWHHRHTWTSLQTLVFPEYATSPYIKFISAILMLHNGPKIKKLSLPHLAFSSDNDPHPPLDLWVRAAIAKEVEELVLDVNPRFIDTYLLPPSLTSCDTLTKFDLSARNIELGSVVSWKSLKKLTLKRVKNLNEDMIRRIMDGSPSLESLSLTRCEGFNRIYIPSGSNLRNLVLTADYHGEYDCIEISAPSVTNLEISGYLHNNQCRLKDVSSLVQVTLLFSMFAWVDDPHRYETCRTRLQNSQSLLLDLLRKINHVEKLVTGTWCTQVLSTCELGKIMPAILFFECKSLELAIGTLNKTNLPGIARLFESSPYLERLTIDFSRRYSYDANDQLDSAIEFEGFDGENYWKSQGNGISLRHLKVVKFIGFQEPDAGFMLKLAEFLLKHGVVLEEFIFQPGERVFKQHYESDFRRLSIFEAVQKLLSFPRSSHQAKVLLI